LASFRWTVRVYYEDTDSGNVVYHANYLKFMERARTERLRGLGYEQDQLKNALGILFAVHSMTIDFIRPAVFNDILEVTADVESCRRASLDFSQHVYRRGEDKPLCTARVRVVCIEARQFRACPIPEPLLGQLNNVR